MLVKAIGQPQLPSRRNVVYTHFWGGTVSLIGLERTCQAKLANLWCDPKASTYLCLLSAGIMLTHQQVGLFYIDPRTQIQVFTLAIVNNFLI